MSDEKLDKQGTGKERQQWLDKAIADISKMINDLDGYKVPDNIRASVGWPRGGKTNTIGQCWGPQGSADGHSEIFISPTLGVTKKDKAVEESIIVYATLVHEEVHAVVGVEAKHGKIFKKLALLVDLTGRMTATTAGPKLTEIARKFIEKNGTFPMGKLSKFDRIGKQPTRLLKCECETCGYIARVTKKWIDDAGTPICPTDSIDMICEEI